MGAHLRSDITEHGGCWEMGLYFGFTKKALYSERTQELALKDIKGTVFIPLGTSLKTQTGSTGCFRYVPHANYNSYGSD